MGEMSRHQLEIAVDYHQFYLWDGGTDPQAPTDYTDEDCRRRVKVADNVLVVQPIRNGDVPCELFVEASDPGWNPEPWQHVVECSLSLPTGHLQVEECTGSTVLDLELQPGTYATRILFGGLREEDYDGTEGTDFYRVQLWPEDEHPLKVVVAWGFGA